MPSHLPTPSIVWPLSDRGLAPRLMDLATLPFVTGEHPHARQAFLGDVDSIDGLTPQGGDVERELLQDSGDRQRIVRGDGWQAHLVLVRRRPEVQVLVTAETAALADAVLEEIRSAVPPPERTDAQARLTLWTAGTGGSPVRHRRWVDAPRWAAIDRNYPGEVREPLARLMTMPEAPMSGGRLLLWYGDPGTGKTTAIRALAHQWQSWADVHFVLDPEAFFGGPDYLMHVVAEEDAWDPRLIATSRWKVLVVEDADELIRADARQEAGASLGRLLNLTDGILGHGLRVLLLITTNEPMRALHPAVVRPGRCLADVQFRPFSSQEANEWLGDSGGPGAADHVTLAELYRLRGDIDTIATEAPPERPGSYL
ncbi:MAG TPA: DUF5925 domain-containing protein [Acidimicrobiales bacterium]|nr:DUF5925 domain-containing protein [Acidimicrobiales bacterium]